MRDPFEMGESDRLNREIREKIQLALKDPDNSAAISKEIARLSAERARVIANRRNAASRSAKQR
jgi:hypothetical protein